MGLKKTDGQEWDLGNGAHGIRTNLQTVRKIPVKRIVPVLELKYFQGLVIKIRFFQLEYIIRESQHANKL
jgi:hypothetical protein